MGLLVAAARTGGLVLPRACPPASERATELPLAFAIHYPANGLTARGAAVACLAAAQLRNRLMASRPIAHGDRRKNFCCVTTRRRNLGVVWCLRRNSGTLTAHTFRRGVLGFDGIVLAPSGLPLRRLPAAELPQAFKVLAVTLVPTPWLVLAPTALAQAHPGPRSSRTGRAAAL